MEKATKIEKIILGIVIIALVIALFIAFSKINELNNNISNGYVLIKPNPNWDKLYPIIPKTINHFLPILSERKPKMIAPITWPKDIKEKKNPK